jgi:hypothetical protein
MTNDLGAVFENFDHYLQSENFNGHMLHIRKTELDQPTYVSKEMASPP